MSLAFWIVTLAVLMGAALAALLLWPAWQRNVWVPALHGIVGTCGLVLLVLALRTPDPHAAALGVGPFALYAAFLFAAAWLLGLAIAFWPFRGRRRPSALIVFHAIIAVSGYVLFMAYQALG